MALAEMRRRYRKSCRGNYSQLEEVRRKIKKEINALWAENQRICRQTEQPSKGEKDHVRKRSGWKHQERKGLHYKKILD